MLYLRTLGLSLALLAAAPVGAAGLTVTDTYARAVPPGQPNSAVFMTLSNPGSEERAVVSAASPAAKVVELHTHRMEDGMMKMRRIERIEVAPGGTAVLKPGGLHVMLIGLTGPLTPGADVQLTLTLDDGSTIPVTAPVRTIDVKSMPAHDHH